MSTSYAAGLAFGIVTALIIFAVIWKFSKKSMKGTFDERQELVRGRGYKYASFTMLSLLPRVTVRLSPVPSKSCVPAMMPLAIPVVLP